MIKEKHSLKCYLEKRRKGSVMENWKDELYHYGVRGMKWKKHNKSALVNAHREKAYNDRIYGAYEAASGRDWDRRGVNFAHKENQRAHLHETTARALESGKRFQAPRVKNAWSVDRGTGLFRRGKAGSKAGYASGTKRPKDRTFRSSGTKKISAKRLGAMRVKRVLA